MSDTGPAEDIPDDAFDTEKQFLASVKAIRLQKKSLYDRLRSIIEDAAFVQTVVDQHKLPLACNERCGRWYCPDPSQIAASVYFKSTDGHTHQWSFSMRRLNLHLLSLVKSAGGVIIVDSTRRGKHMPDALSKTIPIWAAVLNRCRFIKDGLDAFNTELYTPEVMVSDSENDMIATNIDSWAHALLETGVDMALLRQLDKPLRPVWITQSDDFLPLSSEYYPLLLVTASKCVPDGIERVSGYIYHQGGADDEELWSQKLSPGLFWQHREQILSNRDEVENAIAHVVALPREQEHVVSLTRVAQNLSIGEATPEDLPAKLADGCIVTTFPSTVSTVDATFDASKSGLIKLGDVFDRLSVCLSREGRWKRQIILVDNDACKSQAPILALMVLCRFFDSNGKPLDVPQAIFSKDLIRKHLVTLVNSRPGINPPRKYLQALNTYLMSSDYHR